MTKDPKKCSCTRPATHVVTLKSDDPDHPVSLSLCEDRLSALFARRKDIVVRRIS